MLLLQCLVERNVLELEYLILEKHIRQLEERLMHYDLNELKSILADDFLEFGSSGNQYCKKDQLEAAPKNKPNTEIPFTITNFKINLLTPNVVLATYRTLDKSIMKASLRSSIWRKEEEEWQMVFHQGTPTTT